jgi:tRNA (adenine37-N6)-methyltransferase
MEEVGYRPIGTIHSEFKEQRGTPIQPNGANGAGGKVEVFEQYKEGLKDLSGFSHIYLLYHFHLSAKHQLKVKPFMDNEERGVFATRVPSRPNSIGMSIVKISRIENNIIFIEDVDVVDGTPLLDIKPFIPDFDNRETKKIN